MGSGDSGCSGPSTAIRSSPPAVREEVTTEPTGTNLEKALDTPTPTAVSAPQEAVLDGARSVLDEVGTNGDVQLVAAVLAVRGEDDGTVAVVSDDRRIRTVTDGLGAEVTGTIGAVVRAVGEGTSEAAGKAIVRRLDERGLHMTAELRDAADARIEDAA